MCLILCIYNKFANFITCVLKLKFFEITLQLLLELKYRLLLFHLIHIIIILIVSIKVIKVYKFFIKPNSLIWLNTSLKSKFKT
jgi:hypothetical protein